MRHLTLILALLLIPAMAAAQGEGATEPLELHGSVSFSWYSYDDLSDSELDYNRPAARVNLSRLSSCPYRSGFGLWTASSTFMTRSQTR